VPPTGAMGARLDEARRYRRVRDWPGGGLKPVTGRDGIASPVEVMARTRHPTWVLWVLRIGFTMVGLAGAGGCTRAGFGSRNSGKADVHGPPQERDRIAVRQKPPLTGRTAWSVLRGYRSRARALGHPALRTHGGRATWREPAAITIAGILDADLASRTGLDWAIGDAGTSRTGPGRTVLRAVAVGLHRLIFGVRDAIQFVVEEVVAGEVHEAHLRTAGGSAIRDGGRARMAPADQHSCQENSLDAHGTDSFPSQ
jgi:hypothetical protein